MKVLDFINAMRPITALNPEADLVVSIKDDILFLDSFSDNVHLSVSIKCLES